MPSLHRIRNRPVGGSSPLVGSIVFISVSAVELSERTEIPLTGSGQALGYYLSPLRGLVIFQLYVPRLAPWAVLSSGQEYRHQPLQLAAA